MRKSIGAILLIGAFLTFFVNFGIWHLFGFLSSFGFLFNLKVFGTSIWNPLSYFTSGVVGHVWLISDISGAILNVLWALAYSFLLGITGFILVSLPSVSPNKFALFKK
jgi:hypothetical protein